ncbi:hypothetical protein NSK11_contig00155-0017 [Nocardia seriolae]|uniref:Uncharacterized protein n=1 Tax=Nocardia seriolae TaxID=37332 RepID=A0ABC9Z4C7_9NOCA|nr:hypothetical protein NSERKGN1266_42460 [Nocardia seriolae]BEK95773.1 hypothetical protein NSER024013_36790 [Nocardia seriolae]GAM49588.1 hypothetical protein NS07_v2contig00114-0011 [Nocardia seriolae]GAP32385.1 hypothetical protein NSK11_contig00155-0017 [Nocardia seriolae]
MRLAGGTDSRNYLRPRAYRPDPSDLDQWAVTGYTEGGDDPRGQVPRRGALGHGREHLRDRERSCARSVR